MTTNQFSDQLSKEVQLATKYVKDYFIVTDWWPADNPMEFFLKMKKREYENDRDCKEEKIISSSSNADGGSYKPLSNILRDSVELATNLLEEQFEVISLKPKVPSKQDAFVFDAFGELIKAFAKTETQNSNNNNKKVQEISGSEKRFVEVLYKRPPKKVKTSPPSVRPSIKYVSTIRKAPKTTHKTKECIVCLENKELTHFPKITNQCSHENTVCKECIKKYIEVEVQDKGIIEIQCPEKNCKTILQEQDIRRFASKEVSDRFLTLTAKAACSQIPDFHYCLNPNCSSGQIHYEGGSSCPQCQLARAQAEKEQAEKEAEKEAMRLETLRKFNEESEKFIELKTKACPACTRRIEKNEGCDHMTCKAPSCGYEFCWL
ncbi:10521_t:CDS:2 [Ambispora gerdemannii]|uniref:10521_t:CDS:1 n=1 Tax=Ambispora gerdemannii TaxID=144530 RepID=A0A9N8V4B7_9GLOM|nr:10521_t:CDS:2 [Ambispora gerdemannii]